MGWEWGGVGGVGDDRRGGGGGGVGRGRGVGVGRSVRRDRGERSVATGLQLVIILSS